MPAVASDGSPSAETTRPCPGAATSVSGPFSTTTQPKRSTAARTLARRCAATSSDVVPSSRASSPSCGVSTRGPGQSAGSSSKSASASTTIGSVSSASRRRTSCCGPVPRPSPGPSATADAFCGELEHDVGAPVGDDPFVVGERPLHRLEQPLLEDRQRRLRHGDRDVAGVGAHRRERRERRRAGESARAADDEHVTGRVLVVALGAPRHGPQQLDRRESRCRLAELEADVDDVHGAGVEPPGRDDEADLAPVERDGLVGADRRARDLAGRRVDAGRQVDREHVRAGAPDPLDQRSRLGARLAREAGAEERIDDHVRLAEIGRRPAFASTTCTSLPASTRWRATMRPSPPLEPPPQTTVQRSAPE